MAWTDEGASLKPPTLIPCPRCGGEGKVRLPQGIDAVCGQCSGSGQIRNVELRFKLGDSVKLTDAARNKYGFGPSQGQGGAGEVVAIRDQTSPDPTRPYMVKWATHPAPNSYRDEDLISAEPPKPAFRFTVVK